MTSQDIDWKKELVISPQARRRSIHDPIISKDNQMRSDDVSHSLIFLVWVVVGLQKRTDHASEKYGLLYISLG